jgi:hypothetical protein
MRKKLVTKDTVDLVPMTTEQEEKMRKRVATKDTVDLVPMTTNTTQEQIETKAEETVMNLFLEDTTSSSEEDQIETKKEKIEKYAKILYGIVKDQERRFQDQVRELREIVKMHEVVRKQNMKHAMKRDNIRAVALDPPQRKNRKRGRPRKYETTSTTTLKALGPRPSKHIHRIGFSCELCKWIRRSKKLKSNPPEQHTNDTSATVHDAPQNSVAWKTCSRCTTRRKISEFDVGKNGDFKRTCRKCLEHCQKYKEQQRSNTPQENTNGTSAVLNDAPQPSNTTAESEVASKMCSRCRRRYKISEFEIGTNGDFKSLCRKCLEYGKKRREQDRKELGIVRKDNV